MSSLPQGARPHKNNDELAVNTIRVTAADMVQEANSGHPGMPMGMAPVAHALWTKHLVFNPKNPAWYNRDRFLLSNGHGCALQYVLLHLSGYKLSLDDLKQFRQVDSLTPGHPEAHVTPGIEVTTGPLGQGMGNSVGLALAESQLAALYNKDGFELFNNYTYAFVGDGCHQEGVGSEAASLAAHWKLNKLIWIYDDNKVTIDGNTSLSFTENVRKRMEAYGWQVIEVADGDHDLQGLDKAIQQAKQSKDKPTMIQVHTTIGFGAKKAGTEAVHGAALGEDEMKRVKEVFGLDPEKKFNIDQAVYDIYHKAAERGTQADQAWETLFAEYGKKFSKEHEEIVSRFDKKLPNGWRDKLPTWKPTDKADATRNTSGLVLNALADTIPAIIGGSADLTPSNKTELKKFKSYQADLRTGRYIHFGIREHGMAAIGNGIAAYGGFIPYTATFTNFIEYCFPSVRLAALSQAQQLFVTTHDSIGLGEDGPTHQPIEALALCRATPGVLTFRPADGNETTGAYIAALEYTEGPSVFAFCRQNVAQLKGSSVDKVSKGAYVLQEPANGKKPNLILIGSGSETSLAVEAAEKLSGDFDIRVVSMPSTSLFDRQTVDYRKSIITPGVLSISIEALAQYGWERYSHVSLGLTTFGSSGKPADVYKKFELSTPQIVDNIRARSKAYHTEADILAGGRVSLLPTHFTFFSLHGGRAHLADQKKDAPQQENKKQ